MRSLIFAILTCLAINAGATQMSFKPSGGGNVFIGSTTIINGETNTFTSSKTFTNDVLGFSSVTASGFFGDGSGLTGVIAVSTVPCTVGLGSQSVVCNGFGNFADSDQSGVMSGFSNSVSVGATNGFIGGGLNNTVSNFWASILGGLQNNASGLYAVVGGGRQNTASGEASTVPGGWVSVASGDYSFAAGRAAEADELGCFVLNDGTGAASDCRGVTNSFNASFSGGNYFDAPSSTFTGSVDAVSFTGDGSGLTNVLGTMGHAGGFSSTLGVGTTFFAFVPDQTVTLQRITVTVVTAGVGGAGDEYRCQDNTGVGISVTVAAAAAAGTVTTATGSAAIASGAQVSGLLLNSAAGTTPGVNVLCEYSH